MKSASYKLLSLRAKRSNLTLFGVLLVVVFVVPVFASAATSAGVTPGSFWYFFDTASEKIALFFTFNPENKAKKALEYADERLAEIDAIAGDKNPDAVKAAIVDYEGNVTLATEKSKEVKDKGQAESLLASIESSASKNQETLSAVLIKVPEEAKAAITQAIEASKKGQEEAARQIVELKGEVEKLKQEVAELKQAKDASQSSEVEKLKKEVEVLRRAQQPKSVETKVVEKVLEVSRAAPAQPATPTQPTSGANIPVVPAMSVVSPTPQTQILKTIEIFSVNATPSLNSVIIEWQTDTPTNSKIFLSGGSLSFKVYNSESGLSTRHIVNVSGLTSGTTYSYEIESIVGDQVVKRQGSFSTKPDEYNISLQADKTSIQLTNWNYVKITAQVTKNGALAPLDVSFSAPDASKTFSVVKPNPNPSPTGTYECSGQYPFVVRMGSSGYCSADAKVNFEYQPKSLGTHTVSVISNGVTKSVDIQVVEYVKVDPAISDVVNTGFVYDSGSSAAAQTIGRFKLVSGDESAYIKHIEYESDIQNDGVFQIQAAGFGIARAGTTFIDPLSNWLIGIGNDDVFYIQIPNLIDPQTGKPKVNLSLGNHTLTIKSIQLSGQLSGLYRYGSGLPVTFTFEVK